MNSLEIFNIKEINNIIIDYKNQLEKLEHKKKFDKTLNKINNNFNSYLSTYKNFLNCDVTYFHRISFTNKKNQQVIFTYSFIIDNDGKLSKKLRRDKYINLEWQGNVGHCDF